MILPYRETGRPVEERADDLLSRMTLEEKTAQMHALWLILVGRRPAPAAAGRLHRGNGPGGGEAGARPGAGADLARARQPRRRSAHGGASAQPAAEVPVRGDAARDPRAVARGVPRRPDGPRRDDVPVRAGLRRNLEPGSGRARGGGDRARGPERGLPPGTGARARRLPRRALGSHRGDARRGSVSRGRAWERGSSAACRERRAICSPR